MSKECEELYLTDEEIAMSGKVFDELVQQGVLKPMQRMRPKSRTFDDLTEDEKYDARLEKLQTFGGILELLTYLQIMIEQKNTSAALREILAYQSIILDMDPEETL